MYKIKCIYIKAAILVTDIIVVFKDKMTNLNYTLP